MLPTPGFYVFMGQLIKQTKDGRVITGLGTFEVERAEADGKDRTRICLPGRRFLPSR